MTSIFYSVSSKMKSWLYYIFLLTVSVSADCPPRELIHPCSCSYDVLSCGGTHKLELNGVMKRISNNRQNKPKHFKRLEISNTGINEIPANATSDLTFEKIEITASNLQKIHSDAFKGTASRVKEFKAENFANLNLPSPYSTFDLLNSLVNVENIRLRPAKAAQIPSASFKPLKKLINLSVGHSWKAFGNNWITIGDDPFLDFDNLEVVGLDDNKINWISARAFNFRNNPNKRMQLYLFKCGLNASHFNSGWLNNINRPVSLHINDNDIKFLGENKRLHSLRSARSFTILFITTFSFTKLL